MHSDTAAVPDHFDPFSAEYTADPQAYAQQMHRDRPVFYEPDLDMWVVTRYDDVDRILTNYKDFSSKVYRRLPVPAELADRVPIEQQRQIGAILDSNFINIDPPQHTRERKKGQKAFTRPLIAANEGRLRELSNELIDGFIDRGSCDLMGDFSQPLAFGIVLDMIGIPKTMLPQLRDWIDDFFALMAPADPNDPDAVAGTDLPIDEIDKRYARVGEAVAFFRDFLDDRRANPRDDLASAMVHAVEADGTPSMTYEQVLAHLIEIVAAGGETTASLIGHLARFFTLHPEALAEAKADPALWDAAVEESLRLTSIGSHLIRVTTRDVEIGGVEVPKASQVLLIPPAANADESRFPTPLTWDIHRPNSDDHLAFGKGRHKCLGAPLARLEAKVAVEELYRRMPDLAVVDVERPLDLTVTLTVRGIKQLPVAWTVPPEES